MFIHIEENFLTLVESFFYSKILHIKHSKESVL